MSITTKIPSIIKSNSRFFVSLFSIILFVLFVSFLYEEANRPLELDEKFFLFILISVIFLILSTILSKNDFTKSQLYNINNGIIALVLFVLIIFIIRGIAKDPIDFTGKIVGFLFGAIIILLVVNLLYELSKRSRAPSSSKPLLTDMADVALIGVIIYTILWIFLPSVIAGSFGLIYLIYAMSKIDENNQILLNQPGSTMN